MLTGAERDEGPAEGDEEACVTGAVKYPGRWWRTETTRASSGNLRGLSNGD